MNFISLWDFRSDEISRLIAEAAKMKKNPQRYSSCLSSKSVILLFFKPSTRTRISFEVGVHQLGGCPLYVDSTTTQLGRGETIADTARVLSTYADCIVARMFAHSGMLELARSASVPVINALTDLLHPCQVLSDLFTLQEAFGRLKGLNLTYMGNGNNNVLNSLIIGSKKMDINLTVSCPKGFEPDRKIMKMGKACVVYDPKVAAKSADVIYTDKWVSMHEKEDAAKLAKLRKYQVNPKIAGAAKIMHCLPAHRGYEITDDAIDSKNSLVWVQAENRLYAQKALMASLIK